MPVRLLREGILDSEAVNALSFEAEVFYRRLMSVVDDFGRFDGRPVVLRSRLYPLKLDTVAEADVARWAEECGRAGLVELYTVEGKPYVLFKKLGKPRATESKYPAPQAPVNRHNAAPEQASENVCAQVKADESKRAQVLSDVPYSVSYSTSVSSSDSNPTSVSEPGPVPASVGTEPNSAEPFDPLRADQAARKLFEARWNAAGLKKFSRLTHGLHGRLAALLLIPWWAEHYPLALERAGKIPFLAIGAGRQKGAYDVGEFLRDDDECRKIIDGTYDPKPLPTGPPSAKPTPSAEDGLEKTRRMAASLKTQTTPNRTEEKPPCKSSNTPNGSSDG